jgi:hypothetical protein
MKPRALVGCLATGDGVAPAGPRASALSGPGAATQTGRTGP